jgi:hypothetical protein
MIARTPLKQINLFLNRALHRLRQLTINAIQRATILPRQLIRSFRFLRHRVKTFLQRRTERRHFNQPPGGMGGGGQVSKFEKTPEKSIFDR